MRTKNGSDERADEVVNAPHPYERLLAAIEQGADAKASREALILATSNDQTPARGRLLAPGKREVAPEVLDRAFDCIDRGLPECFGLRGGLRTDAFTLLAALGYVCGEEDIERIESYLPCGTLSVTILRALAVIGGPRAARTLSRFAEANEDRDLVIATLRLLDGLTSAETDGPYFPAAASDFLDKVRATIGRLDSPLAWVLRDLDALANRGAPRDPIRMAARDTFDSVAAICGKDLLIEANA